MALLCLTLSWFQSKFTWNWYSMRFFISNRRITWPSCEYQASFQMLRIVFSLFLFLFLKSIYLSSVYLTPIYAHLIITTTLRDRYYYCHFTDDNNWGTERSNMFKVLMLINKELEFKLRKSDFIVHTINHYTVWQWTNLLNSLSYHR